MARLMLHSLVISSYGARGALAWSYTEAHIHATTQTATPATRLAPLVVAALDQNHDTDKVLVTIDTISDEYRTTVEAALATRNTERQLEGKPPYESLEAMVEAYQQYEGDDLGLSREACEDEVLNYLSRKALADEGALDGSPQDYIGFGLLALLVAFVSINGAG